MKVSLANLLKTELEKMSDFVSEQKLMKTNEFYVYEQILIITKGLIRNLRRGHGGRWRKSAVRSALAERQSAGRCGDFVGDVLHPVPLAIRGDHVADA